MKKSKVRNIIKKILREDCEHKEGKMAHYDSLELANDASDVASMISDDMNLPEWVEAKITLAADYMNTVKDYLTHHMNGDISHTHHDLYEKDVMNEKPKYNARILDKFNDKWQKFKSHISEKRIGFQGLDHADETMDLLQDFAKTGEMLNKEMSKKQVSADDPLVQKILTILDDNLSIDSNFLNAMQMVLDLMMELPNKEEPGKIGFLQREFVDNKKFIDWANSSERQLRRRYTDSGVGKKDPKKGVKINPGSDTGMCCPENELVMFSQCSPTPPFMNPMLSQANISSTYSDGACFYMDYNITEHCQGAGQGFSNPGTPFPC